MLPQHLQSRFETKPRKRVHSDALMEFSGFIEPDSIIPIEEHHHEYLNEEEIFLEAKKDMNHLFDVEMEDEKKYGEYF